MDDYEGMLWEREQDSKKIKQLESQLKSVCSVFDDFNITASTAQKWIESGGETEPPDYISLVEFVSELSKALKATAEKVKEGK